jgi:hypothetical protein
MQAMFNAAAQAEAWTAYIKQSEIGATTTVTLSQQEASDGEPSFDVTLSGLAAGQVRSLIAFIDRTSNIFPNLWF